MAVTWVGGTTFYAVSDFGLTANAPTGLDTGDLLLAAVFWRGDNTTFYLPPSGWTLLRTVNLGGTFLQSMAVYSKNTVSTGDSGASFYWQATETGAALQGIVYAALRGVDGAPVHSGTTLDVTDTSGTPNPIWRVTPPTQTASADGQMLVVFCSDVLALSPMTPSPQSGFTLFSGTAIAHAGFLRYRLAGAYKAVNNGEGNSGVWDWAPGDENRVANYHGAITLRMVAASSVDPVATRVSVSSPIGSPAVRATVVTCARLSVPGPLGALRLRAVHDFTAFLVPGPDRYVMDVIDDGGLRTRIGISSWQASLSLDSQSYLQAVVPSAGDSVVALTSAAEFEVLRLASVADGRTIEVPMGRSPVGDFSLAQGPINLTATLSGYSDGLPLAGSSASFSNTLADVRSVYSGTAGGGNRRVRCGINWLLRPGMDAVVKGDTFTVGFINYYVSTDAYMDVGSVNV